MKHLIYFAVTLTLITCRQPQEPAIINNYYDLEETGVKSGGIKMIAIHDGKYRVWTKRVGNNPRIKVLLLHGGPAATHELFESFDSYFPNEGFEYYYYDQLGSYYSDQPSDTSLWNIDRFVQEVEEVRTALGLDSSNFYLLGNSWGGILAMEYALQHQHNLKGLIIANMVPSAIDYGKYADEVLAKQMDPTVLKEIRELESKGDFDNPRYMELLMPNYYAQHLCRIPLEQWPDPVNRAFKHLNSEIYVMMQGPSEFGIAGKLAAWDRKSELPSIAVPTLSIGARHDTMDPKQMEWMAGQVQRGRYLYCPNGSHLSMWDDQEHFFPGLIQFIKDVDEGNMPE
jgi:proline iminopeptidase